MRVTELVDRLATKMSLAPLAAPPNDDQRRAAVAAILHDDRVLLIKRAERVGDPWSGHIALPGGKFEPKDEHLLATAIRETREELSLDLTGARLLGNLGTLHPRSAGPKGIEVTPFVFATEVALEPTTSSEAEAAFWLPLELAASGQLDGTYAYPGSSMVFPSWTYGGHTIWGLTMRILGELLQLAR